MDNLVVLNNEKVSEENDEFFVEITISKYFQKGLQIF